MGQSRAKKQKVRKNHPSTTSNLEGVKWNLVCSQEKRREKLGLRTYLHFKAPGKGGRWSEKVRGEKDVARDRPDIGLYAMGRKNGMTAFNRKKRAGIKVSCCEIPGNAGNSRGGERRTQGAENSLNFHQEGTARCKKKGKRDPKSGKLEGEQREN